MHITATRTVVERSQFFFDQPQLREGDATGSGFVIDQEGHVVTNAHVVEGASEVTVSFGEGEDFEATVVGEDVSSDLAVLKIKVSKEVLVPLPLGDSSKVSVGEPVIAIGNPFDLDRTVTSGIVSALQREISAPNGFVIADVIQTDAAINPGNSGGPLVDFHGRVIGVNSQIYSNSGSMEGSNLGIAFAIPSNTVKRIAEQLVEDGEVKYAYMGVSGTSIDEQLQDDLRLPVDHGVMIADVAPGSAAAKAGLKAGTRAAVIEGQTHALGGDIIAGFNGERIDTMRELVEAVGKLQPGDKVEIEYYRGDDKKTAKLTLTERPKDISEGR